MVGRPPAQLKRLASLVLEYPGILKDIKAISRELDISYDAAKKLKSRYLARSNGNFLCPECLSRMMWSDGGLACQRCGFFKRIILPSISFDSTPITSLYELGSYRPRYGEWKGYERFLWECLDEAKEVLKGYALSPKVLNEIGALIRKYARMLYRGRSDKLTRYKVILKALSEASVEAPALREAYFYYFFNGPLQLKRNNMGTKGTKLALEVVI